MISTAVLLAALAANPLRVMPLGDSYTDPNFSSARYIFPLWERLRMEDRDILFVGSNMDTRFGISLSHEGHGGFTSAQVLANIDQWMIDAKPDVVLFQIGHNDVRLGRSIGNTLEDIREVILRIRAHNPNARIFLAEILRTTDSALTDLDEPYNAAIDELNVFLPFIAAEDTGTGWPVRMVRFPAWDADIHTLIDDGLHPNVAGETLIADAWYEELALTGITLAVPALSHLAVLLLAMGVVLTALGHVSTSPPPGARYPKPTCASKTTPK